jgi:hypothetical protein
LKTIQVVFNLGIGERDAALGVDLTLSLTWPAKWPYAAPEVGSKARRSSAVFAVSGRRFHSIRLPPSLGLSVASARFGRSFLARGLLSDHRRFERLHERDGIGRRRLGYK